MPPLAIDSLSANKVRETDFYYSVLGLPNTATEHEIRERYKSLSLIYHPDKQRDNQTRETASRRFLEIQKAYEVLSDQFTRAVYDVYGHEGLARDWPKDWRTKTDDELRRLLLLAEADRRKEEHEAQIRPRGTLRVALDAQSLFRRITPHRYWFDELKDRIDGVHIKTFALRHTIQTDVAEKIRLNASSNVTSRGTLTSFGTVRYQYTPNFNLSCSTSLLHLFRPVFCVLKAEYEDNENGAATVQTTLFFPPNNVITPPLSFSYNRRLFKGSLTQGVIAVSTGPKPTVDLDIVTPTLFKLGDYISMDNDLGSQNSVIRRRFGLGLAGVATSLRAGWSISFSKLAAEIKFDLQIGLLSGLAGVVTGSWGNKFNGVTTAVVLGKNGVELALELCYLGQRASIPIQISDDYDPTLAAFATAFPASVSALMYHFLIKPRRRREKIEFFREARRAFEEEQSNTKREADNTNALLRDTARKHMQAERAIGGLVILEATYGPTDVSAEAKALMADVTVPLQSLVHKSQLFIPGRQRKTGLPGFIDPTPSCPKSLRIRYLFDDHEHYVEIPDDRPIVLPLHDHLVEKIR